MLRRFAPLFALAMVALAPLARAQAPGIIRCTPTGTVIPGGELITDRHPIVAALEASVPGTLIRVESGVYAPFSIGLDRRAPNNARVSGGLPGRPVVIQGVGQVRIKSGGSDTIAIHQRIPNGHITFKNLQIEASHRAAIMFYKQGGARTHDGFTFEDCDILGGWDHLTGQGRKAKWGLWAHSLNGFTFAGRTRWAKVQNIRQEHGFYIQNPQGDVTIERVIGRGLGRTFCQFTARSKDGPVGRGRITVRECDVSDVGLSRIDGFKGGAAFTVAGRLRGTILFERNRYRAGFDPTLRRLTKHGKPYGTGAFVAWDGGQSRNARLILRDNDFRFAPGCGDRPVVAIGGCDYVELRGRNIFSSGGRLAALSLDPIDAGGRLRSVPNGSVYIAPTTGLEGDLKRRGKKEAFTGSDVPPRTQRRVR